MTNKRLLLPVIVFSFLLSLPLHHAGARWTIEYAEVLKEFAHISQRSIAVDSAGHPHIACGSLHLYYAYHDATHWHYDVADSSSGVGDYSSIAQYPMGKDTISYVDGSAVRKHTCGSRIYKRISHSSFR